MPAYAGGKGNLIFILDASGSMWTQIEGRAKIEIAKDVMSNLVKGLPDDLNVGLIVYGHRKKGDCEDVELIIPLGPLDRDRMIAEIMGLNPRGRTPITLSILRAVDALETLKDECTIVLVSDGKETCEGDPCELVRKLKKIGVNFVMHVIGFDVSKKEKTQLECIAQAGGGRYYTARDAGEFRVAAKKVTRAAVRARGAALCVGAVKNGNRLTIKITLLKEDMVVIDDDNSIRNPEKFYVEPGVYTIQATDTSGPMILTQTATAEFKGQEIVRIFDFSDGHLSVRVIKDSLPINAYFHIRRAGTEERLAAGDTSTSNPDTIRLLPGIYDMVVTNPDKTGRPSIFFPGIRIEGGKTVEKTADFSEVLLLVKVLVKGTPGSGDITVFRAGTDEQVASGDTSSENPVLLKLMPGTYDIVVKHKEGGKEKVLKKKEIAAGTSRKVSLEFSF